MNRQRRKCGDPRDAFNVMRIAAERAVLAEAEVRGTSDGVRLGRIAQQREDRIVALGAIRRAAEVMREYEALGWRASQHGPRVNDLSAVVAEVAIRRAIRAAIGSPKA